MDAGTTTGDVIDALVRQERGDAGAREQHLFRMNLLVLVELAKSEQRQESQIDLAVASLHFASAVIH